MAGSLGSMTSFLCWGISLILDIVDWNVTEER